MSKSRFFIAFLPPPAIQDYANGVKQVFVERFNSRAALKSPPHITLQPTFEWDLADLPRLTESLSQFARRSQPIPVELAGFGAFAPRVIYLNVVKTPELMAGQAALIAHLETNLGMGDPTAKPRPFNPHMTVATRDLTPQNFQVAWAEFQHQPAAFEFVATSLTLLRHDGQRWQVDRQFYLIE